MRRLKKWIRVFALIVLISSLIPLVAPNYAAPFSPAFTTHRVGLFWGTNALSSANLQNVDGRGSGFEFGHFDANRNFVTADASTTETRLTITPGASNTINVTRTGTNTVLFVHDKSTTPLAVRPIPTGNQKSETWFRNERYNGAFQYTRRSASQLVVVNFVQTEDYIRGVIPYEMYSSWPLNALKAQALCARSFAFYAHNRHNSLGFDLCNEVHCQVYRGRRQANTTTDRAVDETASMIVTHNGQLAQTFYASSNGGASESVENVWITPLPYLRGKIDPYEASAANQISGYYWTRTFTPEQLTTRLRNNISGINISTIASIRVSQYSSTGNVLRVTFTDSAGRRWTNSNRTQLMNVLDLRSLRFDLGGSGWTPGGLFANDPAQRIDTGDQFYVIDGSGAVVNASGDSLYAIADDTGNLTTIESGSGSGGNEVRPSGGVFTIKGAGNGHQVGMSQWGAYAMAHHHNLTYEDIIHFYFTGVQITRIGA